MKKNIEKGQTLIEVLAALSITVVLLYGITAAVVFSLSNIQFTKNQNLANHYAEQGMGIVRQIWNSNLSFFNNLPNDSNYYCLYMNSSDLIQKDTSITNGCTGIDQPNPTPAPNVPNFAREVDLFKNSEHCSPTGSPSPKPDATKVIVKVSWTDSKCTDVSRDIYCHKVELVTCLSKTYPLSEP